MFLNLLHKLFGQNINKDKDNFPTVNPINGTPNATNDIIIEKSRKENINNIISKDNNNNELLKLKKINKELEDNVKSLKEELLKEKSINNELLKEINNLKNSKNYLVFDEHDKSKIM